MKDQIDCLQWIELLWHSLEADPKTLLISVGHLMLRQS